MKKERKKGDPWRVTKREREIEIEIQITCPQQISHEKSWWCAVVAPSKMETVCVFSRNEYIYVT